MDVDDKGAANKKGGEGDGASQQQGKSASPSEQPPPRKKKKPAPPPLLAPSTFPSFTDYLFAKYSSGLPGGDEDEEQALRVVADRLEERRERCRQPEGVLHEEAHLHRKESCVSDRPRARVVAAKHVTVWRLQVRTPMR